MRHLRLPLIMAIASLLTPFVVMMLYSMHKKREARMYDFIFDEPVSPVQVEIDSGKPFINSIGMHFAYLPPGKFVMGSPPKEIGREEFEIQHEVVLTQGFYLQTTEVTQAQWQMVLKRNPSKYKGANIPVHDISWNDCQVFVRRLNQLEGVAKYRLPSEAEWEYACRAGDSAISCGASHTGLGRLGWYKVNSEGRPHEAATKSPNIWGLYDMQGNVWEWCQDWWERWYGKFSGDAVTDPVGPPRGLFKIYRGGGWFGDASYQRCASRMRAKPDLKSPGVGFRVARSE